MSSTDVLALSSPVANLQQYTQLVESFPRLDAHEECDLANRFRQDNDVHAAWRLVTAHLRHVVYIARNYQGYGLPIEDLIQEGNIGLMTAVRRFDPDRGVRLMAYAVHWIRACIHDFIIKNWRIVKVATTKARRKLFYKLRSAKQRLEWLNTEQAQNIAAALDVDTDDVLDMESSLYLQDMPFEPPVDAGDEEQWAPVAYLTDECAEPGTMTAEADFSAKASTALADALAALDGRSREIVARRWLVDEAERTTLQELGDRFGISAERVRQLEAKAIRRLRELVREQLEVAE